MKKTTIREPAVAGRFYPGNTAGIAEEIQSFRVRANQPEISKELIGAHIVGGMVPHAGWGYSGALALSVFDLLAQASPAPKTILLFATSHRPDVKLPSIQRNGHWRLPDGDVAINTQFAEAFLEEAGSTRLVDRPEAHEGDHAIEVQLPFLQATLPGVSIVPVAVPLCDFGEELGAIAAHVAIQLDQPVIALASTDLTHYGANYYGFAPHGVGMKAHQWCKEVNDHEFLERVINMDATGANVAGVRDRSACGAAATAATIGFASAKGATKATLLAHQTSWETHSDREEEPTDFVGYATMVMVKA